MESLCLLILLFFIVIITVPLGFKCKISYSLKSNKGALSIKLWFIWIKVAKLKFRGNKLYLIQKYKNDEIEVEVSEPQLKFLKFFNDEVKDKIKFREFFVYSNVGVNNPFYSAILSTIFHNFVTGCFVVLKSKYQRCSFNLAANTSFENLNFIVALNVRFSLSILDVLYSFIVSILRTKTDKLIEKNI